MTKAEYVFIKYSQAESVIQSSDKRALARINGQILAEQVSTQIKSILGK